MTFKSEFLSVQRDLISELGEPVTFTAAAGGPPVSTIALIQKSVSAFPADFSTQAGETTVEISLLFEDVGLPYRGDQIDAGGTTFTVDSLLENNGVVCKVTVHA